MPSQIASILTVFTLVVATLMTLALTVSIALLFTIGKPTSPPTIPSSLGPTSPNTPPPPLTTTTSRFNGNENESISVVLPEPCDCGCPAISPQVTPRIVNGEGAIPNSWPWQLLLVIFNGVGQPVSYCGASLITTRHVLTAAHCVFGFSPRYVGVIPRLHQFNISGWTPAVAYGAQRIYVHEAYDDATLNDDVAVIRLRTPVVINNTLSLVCIAPANMAGQELTEGEPVVATGWGATESANRTRPRELQQVRLQLVSSSHPSCSPLVGTGENQRLGQMCAGFPPRAVCFGDSGGPLVRSIRHSNGNTYWQQVGIMSGTVDCGYRTNYSDVYAHVSYYNPWIVDKVRLSPWSAPIAEQQLIAFSVSWLLVTLLPQNTSLSNFCYSLFTIQMPRKAFGYIVFQGTKQQRKQQQ